MASARVQRWQLRHEGNVSLLDELNAEGAFSLTVENEV